MSSARVYLWSACGSSHHECRLFFQIVSVCIAHRLMQYVLLWVQLDIERKLRGLLTKDKQKAEEEAALAVGLCRGIP